MAVSSRRVGERCEFLDDLVDDRDRLVAIVGQALADVGDADPDVPCLVPGDTPLPRREPGERAVARVLVAGEVLRGSRHNALADQVVHDDSPQEDIRVRRGLERQRVVLEPLVQTRGDRVAVRVCDGLYTLQAADAEHLVVHAQYALQVAKLVGELRGETGLQLVVRCARHERGENRRHAELRLEPVRE